MSQKDRDQNRAGLEVAVIGMAGRFPGAGDIEEFWTNLKNGVEAISFFSGEELEECGIDPGLINNPGYVKAKGILEDVDCFDNSFFGYTPGEAEIMDPQIRIFHECAWQALENAGYSSDSYTGLIGLYAGAGYNPYWMARFLTRLNSYSDQFNIGILNARDYMSTKVSYKLNLKGPSVTLLTACSTSLAAIHLACQALLCGECHIALAGGISILFPSLSLPKKYGILYREGMIVSPDGHCRAFDARANGTVGGDGVGIVVLKPFEDAIADGDYIHAVIKGSALNNDGTGKVGYTAPAVGGQVDVIRTAHQAAGVDFEDIGYIETHGTGTALGDPVEIEALRRVFKRANKDICTIGSVKTNIGHLDTAAGVAGFIKVVLSLKHRLIPPTLNFETPNPKTGLTESPFSVNTALTEWKMDSGCRRAGVSSFGIGGTNAHVILEEGREDFPCGIRQQEPEPVCEAGRPYTLLLLSAKTETALEQAARNLSEYLEKNPGINLADAAYTLQVGRRYFTHRRMIICRDVNEAIKRLSSSGSQKRTTHFPGEEKRPVIFMFPGQGSQYVNMGLELYRTEQAFREEMDNCFEILTPLLDYNPREILYPGLSTPPILTSRSHLINVTAVTQPLLFIFEYALAKMLTRWEIVPDAMIGHSIGEYTAACLSGVFSLKDALNLIVLRGKLMQEMPRGKMLSVNLMEEELRPFLTSGRGLSLAAINSTANCVVSGPVEFMETFAEEIKKRGIECKFLHTSHAFHSTMMDPVPGKFEEAVQSVELHEPGIPYMSNVTGKWITGEQAVDPSYWAEQMRRTVRFADGLEQLFNEKNALFLEVGPGRSLSTFVRHYPDDQIIRPVINLVRHPREKASDNYYLSMGLGQLWLYGKKIDWRSFYHNQRRRRVPLPTYPFERKHYWPGINHDEEESRDLSVNLTYPVDRKKPDISGWFYIPSWKRSMLLAHTCEKTKVIPGYLVFMDENGFGKKMVRRLIEEGKEVVCVREGPEFLKAGEGSYKINHRKRSDYDRLLNDLRTGREIPGTIIHLLGLTGSSNNDREIDFEQVDRYVNGGFYSILHLAQSLDSRSVRNEGEYRVVVLTDNMQEVDGKESLCPGKSAVLGPVKVIPVEYPGINFRSIDVVLPRPGSTQEGRLIDQLLRDIAGEFSEQVIAYRGSYRWVQTFEHVRLEHVQDSKLPLREQGVYIITGGLGGIGLILAEYLAKSVNARLILTGRSEFPPRQAWNEWIAGHDENDDTVLKIKKIRELELSGSNIMVITADAANHREMLKAVTLAMDKFGIINGVIHAAGVPGERLIRRTSREVAENVLSPKLKGVLVLDRIFKNNRLDFFICCSSLNSVVAAPGQADYCAANIFLDTFSHYRFSRRGEFTCSINWDSWQDIGMSKNISERLSEIENIHKGHYISREGILPGEGIEVFRRVLSVRLPQVLVSTQDIVSRIERSKAFKIPGSNEEFSRLNLSRPIYPRPELRTIYSAPTTETERKLSGIWQKLFGITAVGIVDDFFELGGDSLKAITLVSEIQKEFAVEIPLAEIFDRQNIKGLAEFIEEKSDHNQEQSTGSYVVCPIENPVKSEDLEDLYKPFPVTPLQMAYLMGRDNQFEIGGVSTHIYREVKTIFDISILNSALNKIIKRHPMLRAVVLPHGELQVLKIEGYEIVVNDISGLTPDERESRILRERERMSHYIFKTDRWPLFEIKAFKISGNMYHLLLSFDHLLADAFSLMIFAGELTKFCKYPDLELPELDFTFRDYVNAYRELKHSDNYKRAEAYWLSRLADFPSAPVLPMRCNPAAIKKPHFRRLEKIFSREEWLKLKQYAREIKVTPSVLLCTAYVEVLAFWSNQYYTAINLTLFNRFPFHKDVNKIIGDFTSIILLGIELDAGSTFREKAGVVQKTLLEALQHRYYDGIDFIREIRKFRDSGTKSVMPIVFTSALLDTMESGEYMLDEGTGFREKGDDLSVISISQTSQVFIDSIATEINGVLELNWDYVEELFEAEDIEFMFEQYIGILERITAGDCEYNLQPPQTHLSLINELNKGKNTHSGDSTIHKLFEEQVEKFPGNMAVVFKNEHITYEELNKKSNQLAGVLRKKGIRADRIVGLMIEKSIELIVGILGILKAGGAYMPIDPGYPHERIRFILEDSGTGILLTTAALMKDIDLAKGIILFPLDDRGIYRGEKCNLNELSVPGCLAYVIYTSGTTGRPKGAMIEHRNVVSLMSICHDRHFFSFDSSDTWTMFHSSCFDFSVWEIYGALFFGGRLIVIPEMTAREPDEYLRILKKEKVTVLNQTPSAFYNLSSLDFDRGDNGLVLKYVIFGGEILSPKMIEGWRAQYPGIHFVNMYGITETTVHVTYKKISDREIESNSGSVGKPIPTLTSYIINLNLRLLPIGVPGEICVGGAGVCRGYLNRPELTKDKFISNPYKEDETLYRSGDLARLTHEGELVYAGRMDNQVKIRGHRIETSEIESHFARHEAVHSALVIDRVDASGKKYLCAYIVTNAELSVSDLRIFLSGKLPDYMIPSYFIFMDRIPLTANGKVDRKCLPEPGSRGMADETFVPPADETEERLVKIWEEVLDVKKIGRVDDFFYLGGDSLSAVTLITKVNKEFQVNLKITEIFTSSTVAKLADVISDVKYAECSISALEPGEKKEYYTLSGSQRRLYIMYRLEKDNKSYNIPAVFLLAGKIDKKKLGNVFEKIIARHESLRTSFAFIDGEPVQRIHEKVDFNFETHKIPAAGVKPIIRRFLEPFSLDSAPLFRLGIIRIGEEKHLLIFNMHHIISDGWSINIFIKDFTAFYTGVEMAEFRIRYRDFSRWQNRRFEISSINIKKKEEYWLERFKGEIPILNLPLDYKRPPQQVFEGKTVIYELSREKTVQLKRHTLQTETTIFMVMLSFFTIFLSKLSGQEEILVGSPIAGRLSSDLEGIIGLFVNTLVFRHSPSGEKRYVDFLRDVKRDALGAYENQEYHYEDLVEKVVKNRDLSRNPLFDVMLVVQNMDISEIEVPGLKLTPYEYENNIAKFDITLIVEELPETLLLRFEYCTKLFRQQTIARFIKYFERVLSSLQSDPEQRISQVEIIPDEEKRQILDCFNDTDRKYPEDKSLSQLFEEQAIRTPDHIVVVGKDLRTGNAERQCTLSFRELNREVAKMAQYLTQRGVKHGELVCLMVERSIRMLTGIMAILKCGAAYLPLDPTFPENRKRYMLRDSGAKVLYASRGLYEQMEETGSLAIETVFLEETGVSREVINRSVCRGASPSDMAYVIYTSGSTGKPKGIIIDHRNVVNFIYAMAGAFDFRAGKTVLALSTISFDPFILETLLPLTFDLRIVIADEEQKSDPRLLAGVLQKNKIDILQLTPSTLQFLFNSDPDLNCLSRVTELLVGAEPIPGSLFRTLQSQYKGKIYNLYGPTETTVWATLKDLTGENEISIGSPAANTRVYIMDASRHLQPPGIIGELCIAGHGLARGYMNRPELTAEKFVNLTHEQLNTTSCDSAERGGTRLYFTGDLAYWKMDGNIDFSGRIDHQVKVRGFRIELGEIENQLLSHNMVEEVVVAEKEDKGGEKYLCAYIIAARLTGHVGNASPGTSPGGGVPQAEELRKYLGRTLPNFMIPSFFVFVERFPLTASGKIDKKSLPHPVAMNERVKEVALPRDETEEEIVKIWQKVLNVEKIGIYDNFFEIGGHSLKAIRLITALHKKFRVKLSMIDLFRSPTVSDVSEILKKRNKTIYEEIKKQPKKEYYELSYFQQRLWFIYKLEPDSPAFNLLGNLTFSEKVDEKTIKRALKGIVDRHESLRTYFKEVKGHPVQVIFPLNEIDLKTVDLSHLADEAIEEKRKQLLHDENSQLFDLTSPPLFRAALIKCREEEFDLLFVMHHIISDGWSMEILKKEFIRSYAFLKRGETYDFEPLKIQYRDYAVWHNRLLEDEKKMKPAKEFWKKQLAGEVPVLNPGYDFYRSNLESKESGEYRCVIPGQVIRDLKQIAGDHNASLFMALLTGFFMLCAHISGQDDILVGTPGAGRQHDDLKTIIGFFVNTLIIRNKIDFAESFGDFLKRVRENTLQTLEYQGYPLELICGELKIEYPKIPVFFNMLNITELDRDQLKDLSSYHIESVQDAKFDIACYLREYENGVEINVHYYKALFKPLTIEKMMGMYIKLLENISADPGKILREYYSRKKRIRVSSLPGSMESHV